MDFGITPEAGFPHLVTSVLRIKTLLFFIPLLSINTCKFSNDCGSLIVHLIFYPEYRFKFSSRSFNSCGQTVVSTG